MMGTFEVIGSKPILSVPTSSCVLFKFIQNVGNPASWTPQIKDMYQLLKEAVNHSGWELEKSKFKSKVCSYSVSLPAFLQSFVSTSGRKGELFIIPNSFAFLPDNV